MLLVVAAAPLGAGEPGSPEATVCPEGMRTMQGVGLVCPRPNGLFEVFSPAYESLGFIHGTDPVAAEVEDPVAIDGTTTPNCVSGAAGTYFVQVIYARASNDADGYASLLTTIRNLVGSANALVDDAGLATGSQASLKVKCVSGAVEVKNEVLPTTMASASFSTIVSDLRAKGYNDPKVKYWVYYDDTGACSCAGTGHLYNDDSLSASNLNNGNGVSMYAVTFGYNSVRTWLHELGHNMGAVQNSAPRSTLAGHCYDGRDTMCYNDGGANGSKYATSYCATEVFDCGKNDYFHANPPAGSYLATRWNLGNPINRFIQFGGPPPNLAPVLNSLNCSPTNVETGTLVVCSVSASDDSSGVAYTITWGDGAQARIPLSGYVAPGTTQSAQHAYSVAGTMTVTGSVVDFEGLSGNTRTSTITVVFDKTPPSLTVQDPEGGHLYSGCNSKREIVTGRVVWVQTGCVRATATDAKSGVNRVEVYVDGVLVAVDTTAPYEMIVPGMKTGTAVQVRVEAVDNSGNRASQSRSVDVILG